MITITYTQKSEYIGDEYFPEAKAEFVFDDETTSTDILINIIKLLKFAGYLVTKKSWEEAGEEISARGHFDAEVLDEAEIALIEQLRKEEQDEEK